MVASVTGYERVMTPVRTAARAMLGAIFVVQGWNAVRDPGTLATRAKKLTDQIGPPLQKVNANIPTDAETLVRVNGAVQVAGGLALLTPAHRLGAAALAASIVPTTYAGHAFWEFDEPKDRAGQRVHFMKNLGLMGGLIIAALDNDGKPGLAWRARHAAEAADKSARRFARDTRSKTAIARKSATVSRRLPI